MPICQKFSKGVRLLALHIQYQTQNAHWGKENVTTAQWRQVKLNIRGNWIGNAKIQNEMSNRSPHELWS